MEEKGRVSSLVWPVLPRRTNPTRNQEACGRCCHTLRGAGSPNGNTLWSQQSSMVVTAPPPNFCFRAVKRASCPLLPCPGCARGSLWLHQLHGSPFFVSEKILFGDEIPGQLLFTNARLLERSLWGRTWDGEVTGAQEVLRNG